MFADKYIPGQEVFSRLEIAPIYSVSVVSQMFRYGLQNQVAHITQLLSFRLSYYVLGEYKGLAAVGVFGNGISIAESIWLIAKSMSLVQYSWVANSDDQKVSRYDHEIDQTWIPFEPCFDDTITAAAGFCL